MKSADEILATVAAAAGERAVRPGAFEDAIDGVRPAAVVEPESAEAVAAVLEAASASTLTVVVRGGGTKLAWGRVPARVDVVLSTRRLSSLVSHAHGDLTAEAEAGMPLTALNRELAKEKQWLPLESPFESATVGGMLATNDAGPARQRYGLPRDLLIGVRLATPDGQLVKAGGNVVKNVAGYDLGRLVTGSFGSLAVIVSATFKLTPLAPATGTLRFTFDDTAAAAASAHGLAVSQLDPIALDVRTMGGPIDVLVRFASTPAVVEAEMAKAQRLLARLEPRTETRLGEDDEALWRSHVSHQWGGPGTMLKVTWLPAKLQEVLAVVPELRGGGTRVELVGRAALGAGTLRIEGSPDAQVDVVRKLRGRATVFDQVTVLTAGPQVKAAVDVWGDVGETAPLMAAVKRAFDPAGIMNAGRGPV
jgi:glycolate oxidase FAD binding subunit